MGYTTPSNTNFASATGNPILSLTWHSIEIHVNFDIYDKNQCRWAQELVPQIYKTNEDLYRHYIFTKSGSKKEEVRNLYSVSDTIPSKDTTKDVGESRKKSSKNLRRRFTHFVFPRQRLIRVSHLTLEGKITDGSQHYSCEELPLFEMEEMPLEVSQDQLTSKNQRKN